MHFAEAKNQAWRERHLHCIYEPRALPFSSFCKVTMLCPSTPLECMLLLKLPHVWILVTLLLAFFC